MRYDVLETSTMGSKLPRPLVAQKSCRVLLLVSDPSHYLDPEPQGSSYLCHKVVVEEDVVLCARALQ